MSDNGHDDIGYGDAMAELEQILDDLEGDDPDVDLLAARVERASQLIQVCRTRITAARVQVERIVATMAVDDADDEDQDDEDRADEDQDEDGTLDLGGDES